MHSSSSSSSHSNTWHMMCNHANGTQERMQHTHIEVCKYPPSFVIHTMLAIAHHERVSSSTHTHMRSCRLQCIATQWAVNGFGLERKRSSKRGIDLFHGIARLFCSMGDDAPHWRRCAVCRAYDLLLHDRAIYLCINTPVVFAHSFEHK